jgi:hypothetical protein
MKIPNAEHALSISANFEAIVSTRITKMESTKARVFAAALDILEDSAEWLRERLLDAALHEEASLVSDTRFGSLYVLDFDLKTPVGAVTIRSGWIIRQGENIPRLTTCYVRKQR